MTLKLLSGICIISLFINSLTVRVDEASFFSALSLYLKKNIEDIYIEDTDKFRRKNCEAANPLNYVRSDNEGWFYDDNE